jgi:V/A-type H+-transporting ATPase subunit I
MLVPMRRIDIVVTRSVAPRAMRAIHRAGLVHLRPFEPAPGIGPAVFGPEPADVVPSLLVDAQARIAELAALLGSRQAPPQAVRDLWNLDDGVLAQRIAAMDSAASEAQRLATLRLALGGEIARLHGYRELMASLSAVVGGLPRVRGYASTGIVVAARYRPYIRLIRDELESLTGGRCEVIAADQGQDRVAAILLYPVRDARAVEALLGGRDLEEVTLPEEFAGVPFDELGPRLDAEQDRLRLRLAAAEAALLDLGAQHGGTASALRQVLSDRIAEQEALRAAGGSEHVIVIAGWVPASRVEDLRGALAADVGAIAVVVEHESSTVALDAPVAMENGPVLRAFESLASFVAVPRYGTIDPTPLLGLTLPAFIGLMVGDAGYALVMLVLLVAARRRWRDAPLLRTLWPIGLATICSTAVFGVLFGEYFGETGRRILGVHPLWLERREGVLALLILALSIGVGQVSLGLALGIVNARQVHHRRDAVSRSALLGSVVAGVVLLAAVSGFVPGELALVAASALALAAVILALTVGISGPIELLGAFGNVLSYARLMAIGLAGVMLALVADRLGALAPNVLAGLLVAVTLHSLNLVLGVFDASIQGLRLHYVEFFSKFVEPGGARYAPFTSVVSGGQASAPVAGGL